MRRILDKYLAVLLTSASFMIAAEPSSGEPPAAEEAAITSTLEELHKALAAGEADKVMGLLLPDALIVEAGNVETRADYQQKHLSEDMAFARAVPVTSRKVVVRQEGNAAWVTTMSRMVGEFHGQLIDSSAAETALLIRDSGGWRIYSLHWSTHPTGSSR